MQGGGGSSGEDPSLELLTHSTSREAVLISPRRLPSYSLVAGSTATAAASDLSPRSPHMLFQCSPLPSRMYHVGSNDINGEGGISTIFFLHNNN